MAYLRREKEIVEVDYPIRTVWESISKAISSLEWKTEEANTDTHKLVAKTKSGFMAYSSTFTIEATAVSEKTTRVTISAETPVTTITGIVDFGKTRERIDNFLLALTRQVKGDAKPEEKGNKDKDS